MKKLIPLLLFLFIILNTQAQKSSEYMYGGRQPKFQKVELSEGDYLIKTSKNMWMSGLFSILSSACILIEVNNIAKSSSSGLMYIPASIFGGVALYHSICIPINLNRAGKASNREKTQQ